MNKQEITARIKEIVIEYSITDQNYPIYWNEADCTGSGSFTALSPIDEKSGLDKTLIGKRIQESEIAGIIERVIKDIEGPIYLYIGRDDGIVSLENEYLKRNHPEDSHEKLKEYYDKEMAGLFIGWD